MAEVEATSLEAMLNASETKEAPETAPPPSPETGDKQSAAPPADAPASADLNDDIAPHVPRRALEDERRKRQELERRLADLERSVQPRQQQQRQPNHQQPNNVITADDIERLWWENPSEAAAIVQDIATKNAMREAQTWMMSRELDRSEKRARKAHGDEIVTAALEQAKAVGKIGDFIETDDPYQSLIDWYQETEAIRNPQSAREKLRAELMAEMGLSPPVAKNNSASSASVPKSLASRTSAQPRAPNGQFQERTPLEELLR